MHADFLVAVSVYVSALGLQGCGMSARDTQGQGPAAGCEEGVVLAVSHSPTDPGTQDITTDTHTHTLVKRPVACDWISNSKSTAIAPRDRGVPIEAPNTAKLIHSQTQQGRPRPMSFPTSAHPERRG